MSDTLRAIEHASHEHTVRELTGAVSFEQSRARVKGGVGIRVRIVIRAWNRLNSEPGRIVAQWDFRVDKPDKVTLSDLVAAAFTFVGLTDDLKPPDFVKDAIWFLGGTLFKRIAYNNIRDKTFDNAKDYSKTITELGWERDRQLTFTLHSGKATVEQQAIAYVKAKLKESNLERGEKLEYDDGAFFGRFGKDMVAKVVDDKNMQQ